MQTYAWAAPWPCIKSTSKALHGQVLSHAHPPARHCMGSTLAMHVHVRAHAAQAGGCGDAPRESRKSCRAIHRAAWHAMVSERRLRLARSASWRVRLRRRWTCWTRRTARLGRWVDLPGCMNGGGRSWRGKAERGEDQFFLCIG
eukprot:363493-Chlamydomonas_euryale.AAC.6